LRSHYQIVWLISEGKTTRQVMEVTGYSRGWIQQLASRYSAYGPGALGDRRHQNPGAKQRALLDRDQQRELSEALKKPPPDGGMWNSRKVGEWIEAKTSKEGSEQEAERLGVSKEVGHEHEGPQALSPEGQQTGARGFQKKLPMRVLRLKEAYPTAKVELWCEDEHERAAEKHILLVLDQAGWHTSKELKVPEGIDLEFVPSASPELQPSERLWPLSNEGVANRHFEEIEELEEALIERCVALCDQLEVIRSYTRYHWWPQAA
jgi:hypothetical protein